VTADATLGAVEDIIAGGGDADNILRGVVAILHERPTFGSVALSFVEEERFVLGPSAGELGTDPHRFPVTYDDQQVAELAVDVGRLSEEDRALLERVAALLGPYCLVGWDTGGKAWSP
jgi:hypothetical protein